MWACSLEIMCWILSPAPNHTPPLAANRRGLWLRTCLLKITTHLSPTQFKRKGCPCWKGPLKTLLQLSWSEREREREKEKDVETEEETWEQQNSPHTHEQGRPKINKDTLPAASLHCQIHFGLDKHLSPTDSQQTGGGATHREIRQSL